jgi:putative ABC transport system permease protein
VDFHDYVRHRLPPLALEREPEILHELAQHLSDVYDEARAAGATHEAAVARAHEAMPRRGDALAREIESASRALPGLIADRWRSLEFDAPGGNRRFGMLSDIRQDVRYGIRTVAANPAFAIVVFLTLALGIGATAVIFTAIDAILLQSPGVANAHSLVSVYNATTDGRDRFSVMSYPDVADLRESGVFQDLAASGAVTLAYDSGAQAESIQGEIVTGNFFDVLGTPVSPGRGFLPIEDERGTANRAVVVSHAFWQTRLAANPNVAGSSISLNGQPYTIVGVAPPLFVGATVGRAPDVWLPMAHQQEIRPPSAGLRRSLGSADLLRARGPRWLSVIGRLKPGTSIAQAAAAADVVARRLQAAYPDTNRFRDINIVPLGEGPGVRASSRPLLRLLSGAVLLVLLIACANVASVLLARGVSRRREVAVRVAVGARRTRLIRQWLTESVLLSLFGGAGGLLLAYWSAPLLHVAGIPETVHLATNGRVLLFTFVVAVASGIAFGLAPVAQTLRTDTLSALRDEGGAVATGNYAGRMRRGFVVFQVAVSLMLLVGAGLFLRTLQKAHAVDLGYRVDSTMVADINLEVRGYSPQAGALAYRQILERIRDIPGVEAAGAARVTVLSGGARLTSISVDGRPLAADDSNAMDVRVNVVTDGYLDALGIPLLRGRDFLPSDDLDAPRVAIVSRLLANKLWPNEDPVGKTLFGGEPATVVGVVADTVYRSAIERDPPPFYYLPLAQNYESGVAVHVRAGHGDPLELLPAVRAAVRGVDPLIVVARPQRLRSVFEQSIASQRMMATLVGLFGAIALALAAVGVYGVMAHLASQRRTEIGIRLALGASPSSILKLIVAEGLRLVGIGAAIGLALATASTRWISSQLFGVQPTDPVAFAAGCVLLALVGVTACLIPARRAMRVQPSAALRNA